MKDKILNLLSCFCVSRCLIIISVIVFITSCEKENYNPKQAFDFQKYFFVQKVECYDTSGNRFDSLSYRYSQNNLIFSGEFELPYEKIELNADGTMKLYYKGNALQKTKNGRVVSMNDSLYFYSNDLNAQNFLFKGIISNNQLRIPGYGYVYYTFSSNGFLTVSREIKTIKLGKPDFENLLKEFPSPPLGYARQIFENLYLQRFDLVYEVKHK